MIRHVLIFVITAAVGALIALAVRSAWHRPYATTPAEDHEQHAPTPSQPTTKPTDDPHAGHAAPVNSVNP